MKNLMIVCLSLFTAASAFASGSKLECKGAFSPNTTLVLSATLASDQQLASAKAFYLEKGQQPIFSFAMTNVSALAGKRDPQNTLMFQIDRGYGDVTTLYLPNNTSSYRGKALKASVLLENDGVSPTLVKLNCNVK